MKNHLARIAGIIAIMAGFIYGISVYSPKVFSDFSNDNQNPIDQNSPTDHHNDPGCPPDHRPTPTSTPTPTPTPTPVIHRCDDNFYPDNHHNHDDCITPTKTPTVTPTPTIAVTPTPTPAITAEPTATPTPMPPVGPWDHNGDGLSDGRSDGLSSCPQCTAPPQSQGQVLGASTEYAGTGVADEIVMNIVGAIGGVSTVSGLVLSVKKKLN